MTDVGETPCKPCRLKALISDGILFWAYNTDARTYSGLNLNQDKAMKPQTVQIVRQGEATPYWFKFNPL
ncbi:hypothetical protein [Neisseria sp. Marseille-Q6792]|uniref:hypothetical protein n=1 Tax=Neisseria sp. Marseille-Q6792 TaxID=2937985 RepID=UPI0032D59B50